MFKKKRSKKMLSNLSFYYMIKKKLKIYIDIKINNFVTIKYVYCCYFIKFQNSIFWEICTIMWFKIAKLL